MSVLLYTLHTSTVVVATGTIKCSAFEIQNSTLFFFFFKAREWAENTHSRVAVTVTQDESPRLHSIWKLHLFRSKPQEKSATVCRWQHPCICEDNHNMQPESVDSVVLSYMLVIYQLLPYGSTRPVCSQKMYKSLLSQEKCYILLHQPGKVGLLQVSHQSSRIPNFLSPLEHKIS